jgi:queuine tRNA-ribosyltransferase
MPVGTVASVKGYIKGKEDINQILFWETPIIYIYAHMEILEKAGGLHKFMNWDRNILTDSGGYQVYPFG